jgi:hypothetical protein
MKTYVGGNRIRLVGRAWEIRRFLKLAQQRVNMDVTLQDYISEYPGLTPHF